LRYLSLTAENVIAAPLCFDRLIGRLENSTIFDERVTKLSDGKEVKRENENTKNGCG